MALFRQPADRTAARPCRRRHGHGDHSDLSRAVRAAMRQPVSQTERGHSSSRPRWHCRRRSALMRAGGADRTRVLFEHGALHGGGTMHPGSRAGILALGLPAQVLVKTLVGRRSSDAAKATPLIASPVACLAVATAVALGSCSAQTGMAAAHRARRLGNALASRLAMRRPGPGSPSTRVAAAVLPLSLLAARLAMAAARWFARNACAAGATASLRSQALRAGGPDRRRACDYTRCGPAAGRRDGWREPR